ncbi:MAG: oligosaccharide flippase family protein [Candidatus Zixiibacteriota bacterium]
MRTPRERLGSNIFSSWVATAASAIIAFFMSPFLVHTLGKEQYGIWALALSIISYTALINAGMNQTLSRYAPKYYASGDDFNLNQVVNSIFLIFSISGLLVLAVSAVVAFLLIDFFNIEPRYLDISRHVILLVGLNQAISFFYVVPSALGPFHRYALTNAVEIGRNIIGAAVTVYFLMTGHGLLALATITVVMTLLSSQIRTMIRSRLIPQIRYSIKYITRLRIAEMLNYGGISFLIMTAYLVIFNTDNIVIGLYLSTTAVTFYSIAGSLMGYIRVIAHAVSIPLVPLVSHLDSTADMDEIKKLFYSTARQLYYIYAAIGVSILVLGDSFIYLWMGNEFGSTVTVLWILIVPTCVCLPLSTASSVLLGIGKHKKLFYLLAVEAVSNIVLSIILVQRWGIYGVAWGTAIPQIVIYVLVYPIMFHRIIESDVKIFYNDIGRVVLLSVLTALPPALLLDRFVAVDGWPGLLIKSAGVVIAVMTVFWWKLMNQQQRERLLKRFARGQANR